MTTIATVHSWPSSAASSPDLASNSESLPRNQNNAR